MTLLFLDIETIPSQKPNAKDDIKIEAPGNYKKPASIQKWIDENTIVIEMKGSTITIVIPKFKVNAKD